MKWWDEPQERPLLPKPDSWEPGEQNLLQKPQAMKTTKHGNLETKISNKNRKPWKPQNMGTWRPKYLTKTVSHENLDKLGKKMHKTWGIDV